MTLGVSFNILTAQTTVSGIVKEEDGNGLPAANLVVKGTTNGTMTDSDGGFFLTLGAADLEKSGGEISVSYMGYASQSFTYNPDISTYEIVLKKDVLGMSEVVVTGMVGERKKTMTPFSISTVSKAQLDQVSSMSAESAIRGKIAGAKVVKGSGKPGNSASVQLRGATSINASGRSQSPLYIIDGVILSQKAAMADIDASDISSIEVVKGAAGASLYGSRAAQGVVKIETNRGKDIGFNQTKIKFKSETGYNSLPKKMKFVKNHHWKVNGDGDYIDADGNVVDPRSFSGRIPDEYAPGTGISFQDNEYKYVETGRPGYANSSYDLGEIFTDMLNGVYDVGEEFTDSGNGIWDINEVWTDANGNGVWDEGEPLDDIGNGVWDEGEDFVDAGNGVWDEDEAFIDGNDPTLLPDGGFDHFDRFFNPGQYSITSVSIGHNTPSTNFYTSIKNTKESGVIAYLNGNERNSLRVNLDHALGNQMELSTSTYFSQSISDEPQRETIGWTNPFADIQNIRPSVDLLAIDNTNYEQTAIGGQWNDIYDEIFILPDPIYRNNENPLYSLMHMENTRERNRFLTNLKLNYVPYSWLGIETNLSYDRSGQELTRFYPKDFKNEWGDGTSHGWMLKENEKTDALNGDITISLNKKYTDLNLRSKLRYLFEKDKYESVGAEGDWFAVAGIPSLGATTRGKDVGSLIQEINSEGYFFISGFDYKNKYILDVLLRRDGSSLFGADERWQSYYRTSFAYRLSEENYWDGLKDYLNEFKIRFSQGTAGNRPKFSAQYETYSIDGGIVSKQNSGNSELKPEFSTETEFGFDGIILDRFSFQFTKAHAIIEDQILLVPLQTIAGYQNQWKNAGTLECNTTEFSLQALLMQNKNITWTSNFNFDKSTQKIKEFNLEPYSWSPRGGPFDLHIFYNQEGEDLGSLHGNYVLQSASDLPDYVNGGNFQVNDDGYAVWVGGADYTDGIANTLWGTSTTYYNADSSESSAYNWGMPIIAGEKQIIGTTVPDFNYAFSTNFQYKRFSFYALFEGQVGGNIYNFRRHRSINNYMAPEIDQADKKEGYKKPTVYYDDLYNNGVPISHFVEDGTYLKLQELAVRFRPPMNLLGMDDNIIITFSGRNLWTRTDYSGYDPEVGIAGGTGGSATLARIDTATYPNFRTYSFSLELAL